tara:strand:- start:1094 stop:1546 length:453 start_codon:yes stop_codon:yes gene_type:complete
LLGKNILDNILKYGDWGLFIVSFLAATVLPFSSEPILMTMLIASEKPWFYLVIIATTGNWFGGITNYLIGRAWKKDWIKRYLHVDYNKIQKYKSQLKRYGFLSALLCWVPFIGDPIAIALGWFRAPWLGVILFMLIGKISRYLIISIPFI